MKYTYFKKEYRKGEAVMKINKHFFIIGMVLILSACAASCGNVTQTDAADNEAVTEASVASEERETSLSKADDNSDKAELNGKGYRLYYDTGIWVDSTYLNEQLQGSDSASLTDHILELKNDPGNFIIINNNNVGKKGEFSSDKIGAEFEAAVAQDEKAEFISCRDIDIGGNKGVCIKMKPNDDTVMEMWYFWHGTYQTLISFEADEGLFDEYYPEFMEMLNSAELD